MRVRSFSAASRATSARAAASSLLDRMRPKKPHIAMATSGIVISQST